MFELASLWVLLLLPIPLLVYFFIAPSNRSSQQNDQGVIVPFYAQLAQTRQNDNKLRRHSILHYLLLGFIWSLLVVAAAKPQWIGDPQALPTSGRDLLLAVDISGSMEEQDMSINNQAASRIMAVKKVVSEFVDQRQGDRIGLILFGSNAYLQTPLTFDTQSVNQFLQEAQVGFAGKDTAIGDAIGLAVKRLKNNTNNSASNSSTSGNSKVIILLTDGENTAGEVEPLQAAKLATKIKAKIYTVGIGADEMIVRDFFGARRVNPSAALDEKTLTAIANTTGGLYFRARNVDDLNKIYQELDKLEPTQKEPKWLRPTQSLFMWPLGLALLLSILFTGYCHRIALALGLRSLFSRKSRTLKSRILKGKALKNNRRKNSKIKAEIKNG